MKLVDLMSLRDDSCGAHGFEVWMDNPFLPINYTLRFDRMGVNLSASPYICLKNECSTMMINFIKEVRKEVSKKHGIVYSLKCLDYLVDGHPSYVTVKIKIFPKTS